MKVSGLIRKLNQTLKNLKHKKRISKNIIQFEGLKWFWNVKGQQCSSAKDKETGKLKGAIFNVVEIKTKSHKWS